MSPLLIARHQRTAYGFQLVTDRTHINALLGTGAETPVASSASNVAVQRDNAQMFSLSRYDSQPPMQDNP